VKIDKSVQLNICNKRRKNSEMLKGSFFEKNFKILVALKQGISRA
jgi:hypothetical protein